GVAYGLDDPMPGTLMELLPDTNDVSPRIFSMLVTECGSRATDGNCTAIASGALLGDQQRDPGWSTNAVERRLRRNVGIDQLTWLPNGLNRGAAPAGWGGYLDQLVAFHSPGRVLLHTQPEPSHPDHAVTNQTREILSAATDAQGNALE